MNLVMKTPIEVISDEFKKIRGELEELEERIIYYYKKNHDEK